MAETTFDDPENKPICANAGCGVDQGMTKSLVRFSRLVRFTVFYADRTRPHYYGSACLDLDKTDDAHAVIKKDLRLKDGDRLFVRSTDLTMSACHE